MPYTYEFPRPSLTVDVALFTMVASDLAVLLIRREKAPFRGAWALPGGFVDLDESLHAAALRELEEETGVRNVDLEQLGAFGEPGRDPRGHTVTVGYLGFVVAASHPVKAGDDAAEAAWVPLKELAVGKGKRKAVRSLAFDHGTIIECARLRLKEHLNDPARTAPFEIVPPRFTLTELQRVYEAVLGRNLDKRNFRARLLARGLVVPVQATKKEGAHRPAQLYRWKKRDGIRQFG